MRKLSLTLASAALLAASCQSVSPKPESPAPAPVVAPAPEAKAAGPSAVDESAMDPAVDPCEDFFHYACGGWIKNTPLPSDQPRWVRSFSVINKRNEELLRDLMEKNAAGQPDPHDPYAVKVGDFYATCMDEAKAETASLATLQERLKAIDAIKDPKALARVVGALHQVGARPLFNFSSEQDSKDATQVIGGADQGGMGLPDRDYYLKDEPKMLELRKIYEGHVANMLALAGATPADAAKQAATVLKLETALAKGAMDKVARRDPYKVYHRIERKGLTQKAPHFAWDVYFTERAHPAVQAINVKTPDFFVALDGVVTKTPLPELKTYLRWKAIEGATAALGKAFVDERFRFTQSITGQKELAPRWKRCVQMTGRVLGEAVGRSYVAVTVGDEGKTIAKKMLEAIELAFAENLASVSWMDDETRAASREKLKKIANKIAYPDTWRNYDALPVDRTSPLRNLQAGNTFEANRDLDKIGKPLDRSEWPYPPAIVNASYDPSLNDMTFPAGILNPPFFSPTAPAAANHGGIGMVIGHELTHGFDDEGRQYDGDGNLRTWWTQTSNDRFNERAACVANQYDQYLAVDDVHLNGKLTLGENIADIGGIKLSLAALRAGQKGAPPATGGKFSQEQQFFLAFAQGWCEVSAPQYRRLMANIDPHSTAQWRVNGPVADSPDFAAAFQCKPGAKLNPAARCVVW